jgi:hypothetical protein
MYEINVGKNLDLCNEIRANYGCAFSEAFAKQNPKKTRSRLSGILAQQESEIELPPGASDLRDDCGIRFTVC